MYLQEQKEHYKDAYNLKIQILGEYQKEFWNESFAELKSSNMSDIKIAEYLGFKNSSTLSRAIKGDE